MIAVSLTVSCLIEASNSNKVGMTAKIRDIVFTLASGISLKDIVNKVFADAYKTTSNNKKGTINKANGKRSGLVVRRNNGKLTHAISSMINFCTCLSIRIIMTYPFLFPLYKSIIFGLPIARGISTGLSQEHSKAGTKTAPLF